MLAGSVVRTAGPPPIFATGGGEGGTTAALESAVPPKPCTAPPGLSLAGMALAADLGDGEAG